MPRIMSGLPRFVKLKHGNAGGMDGELATFFETDPGLEFFSPEMEFYDEKGKKKFKESGESSRNNNFYTSVSSLAVNSDQGIENQVFEDLISIVDSARMPGNLTTAPDFLPRSAAVQVPGTHHHHHQLLAGAAADSLPLHRLPPSASEEGERRATAAPPSGFPPPSSTGGRGAAAYSSSRAPFLVGGGGSRPSSRESLGTSPPSLLGGVGRGHLHLAGTSPPSLGGRGLMGTSPPSRNTSIQGEAQTEATSSNQKKLFYSSLGYPSVPGLRIGDRAPSVSPSGGRSSKSPVSGRLSCSPPVTASITRRLSSGDQLTGVSSSSPPVRSSQTRRLSNSEHKTAGSPTRVLSGGRLRRNSCEQQRMSCSPPGSSPGSGWSAATWSQLQLPSATTAATAEVLTAASVGGSGSGSDQRLPSLRSSFPGGSGYTTTTAAAVSGNVNGGSAAVVGGQGGWTERRSSSAPSAESKSPLRDQDDKLSFPGSMTEALVSPVPSSTPAYHHQTSCTTPVSLCSPRWSTSTSPASLTTTSPLSSATTNSSDLSSPLSRIVSGSPAEVKPVPDPPPPIRPENSILRQQLQGKLSNRYNSETVTCRECGKMLTVKCIMGTCLKSDEVLCQSCNMELTVKCILGSCKSNT